MKITNIALHTVLAVIGTASRASAKGFFRGSVEEKEDVRRDTMGDQVHPMYLDKCSDGRGVCDSTETCGALIDDHDAMTGAGQTVAMLLNAGTKGLANIQNDVAYMEACYEIVKQYDACVGCQGYELEKTKKGKNKALTGSDPGMVHIPGCLNMSAGDCKTYASQILADHPEWFPDDQTNFIQEQHQITSKHEQWYWMLAIPVDGKGGVGFDGATESAMEQKVHGFANTCLVHYPYLWCTEIATGNSGAQCEQLAPFDCTDHVQNDGTCLSVGACCAKINGDETTDPVTPALYPWPDINGNKLQCYAWQIGIPENGGETHTSPTRTGTRGTGASAGPLRLIMHINNMRVVLPAIITSMTEFTVEADSGIAVIYDEDNINTWTQDNSTLDEYMKEKGKALPVFNERTELKMGSQLEMAQANNQVWKQDPAATVPPNSGYYNAGGKSGPQTSTN